MKYKFMTVSVLDSGEDEARLNAFLSSCRVASVERQFMVRDSSAFWCFAIQYIDDPAGGKGPVKPAVDYKEVLSPDEFDRYARLRELRNSIAKNQGKPAYAVFTNEQLAGMVTGKVRDMAGLSGIPGIGTSRLKQYSPDFLVLLQQLHPGQDS